MIKLISRTFFLLILLILFPIQSLTIIEQNTHDLPYNTQLMMDAREASKTLKIDLNYGKIPLYFVPNIGQVDEKALFYSKASKYTLWITNDGLLFDGRRRINKKEKLDSVIPNPYEINNSEDFTYERDVSRLVFLNSNKNIELIPVNQTEHKVNYFIGSDKSKWRTNISTSKAVLYKELYKNVDLKIYGIEKQIEYDFIVKPDGEVTRIRFKYKNVKNTKIDKEGNLIIETKFGELKHAKPLCYQVIKGEKIEIGAEFKETRKNTYGFKVQKFNADYELIIDPLIYSTYIGGSSSDSGRGIAVDASGNAYVSGTTYSDDFPITSGACDTSHNGYRDVFITKINSTGTDLIYSTYLGGWYIDGGFGIAVDGSGNAYVTGNTISNDFPTTSGAYDTSYNNLAHSDIFVTKLNSSGDDLDYSTYLGYDYGVENYNGLLGIAVDGSGNAYVTGWEKYSNYYYGVLAFTTNVILKKLNATGTSLIYNKSFGWGSADKRGYGIAVDGSGNAYVTGYTKSDDLPTTTGAYDTISNGREAFITKIDSTGTDLLYSTYLGGDNSDCGYGIAVDGSGKVYVTGYTSSTDFPTTSGAYDTSHNGGTRDIFVTKIDPAGNGTNDLLYSTFLGGSGDSDYGRGIAVDGSGNTYVTGDTDSIDFPTTSGAYDTSYNSGGDAFITKIDPAGNGTNDLLYSTFLGGTSLDHGYQIAVDSEGAAYVAGYTISDDFPTKNPIQASNAGETDVFISKINNEYTLTISAGTGGTTDPEPGTYAYDENAEVGVEAIPESGYEFSGWSGDASGTENPITITMDADKSITANFIRRYKLTITAGTGGTTNPSPGTYTYDVGTEVTITATPETGYGFANWSGDASGTDNPITITMDSDRSIQADFIRQYTLTIAAGSGGTTDPLPGSYTYDTGTSVSIKANPDDGYEFTGWSGDASGTSNTIIVTMDSDKSVTANFIKQYTLTISAGTGGTTDPAPGSSSYDEGTGVSITAIPDSGYRFSGWTGDVPSGHENDNPVTITMDSDKSITATFIRQYTLTIVAGTGGTTNPSPRSYDYDSGTQVSVTAIPDSGYQFSSWSGDASGTATTITINMDSDKSITANFTAISTGDGKKGGCFIATAAYGSQLHPHLDILRDFRDRYLMPKKCGRMLVSFYYKYSPFVAELIANNKVLKVIVQINLLPFVVFSYSLLHFGSVITAIMLALIFMVPIFLISYFRRKLKRG